MRNRDTVEKFCGKSWLGMEEERRGGELGEESTMVSRMAGPCLADDLTSHVGRAKS